MAKEIKLPPLPDGVAFIVEYGGDVYTAETVERLRREAIEAYKAQQQEEAVLWQFRWTNPGDNPGMTEKDLEWEEVAPRWNGTVAEKVVELESYRYKNRKVYECRALYANPAPAQQPLTDEQIDEIIGSTHFHPTKYQLTESDKGLLTWYRLGIRDAERAHNIGEKP